ncbi:MAG: hypothetical protein LBP37_06700, partial [Spirochaetaceae bacterium]|jgi:hypothetical protein|nr:hypothetical protein [Spirochaetaceae bacterium]
MKKSFLYAVPAALIMALLFAGCPQDSDDEDSGGTIPSYQKDVDGIAVAFADGAPVVYLKDNLHLENNELVIPAGKTLDLSRNVTIDEIGINGKIVAVGNINFTDDDKYDILLVKSAGAKIIATQSFIDANVDTNYEVDDNGEIVRKKDSASGEEYPKEPGKHIKAFENQVIPIADFDIGSKDAWENHINKQIETGADNVDYIPVQFNSTIDKAIAGVVGFYGSGRRVYIIGDVTITGHINLTGTKWTPGNSGYAGNFVGPVQYNVSGNDQDGSLLIAGAVVFEDGEGQVSTEGGLTVLGTLTTKGNRLNAKVNAKGKLVTYLLRLESGGGGFADDVQLIGILPSRFGGQSVFAGNLTARGPVIIDSVTFQKGATFENNVEFLGPDGSVKASETITINGNVTLNYPGNPVNLKGSSPTISLSPNANRKSVVTYSQDYGTTGQFHADYPVIFNGKASFGASGTFSESATFNSDLALSEKADSQYLFSGATYFAKPIKLNPVTQLIGGTFGGTVTFNGPATFDSGSVGFAAKAVFKNDLVLNAAGTFSGGAEFGKSVTFAAGSRVTVGSGAALKHIPSNLTIKSVGEGESYIDPAADGGLILTPSGDLEIVGTLGLGSASINIGNGKIRIPITTDAGSISGIVFGTEDAPSYPDGKGYIISESYTVNAGTSQGGTLVGLFGTVTANSRAKYVFLDKAGFRGDDSGSQATLRVAGSYAIAASNIEVSKDITIDGVTIDFVDGGVDASAGSITIAPKTSPVITLKGGKGVAVGGGTVYSGVVGGIRSAAGAAVYGGSVGITAASGDIPPGYIVGLKGKLVAGSNSSTYSETLAGSKGVLGTEPANSASLISTGGGFAVYWERGLDISGVKGILDSTGDTKRFTETDGQSFGGSVAVFAGTLTE